MSLQSELLRQGPGRGVVLPRTDKLNADRNTLLLQHGHCSQNGLDPVQRNEFADEEHIQNAVLLARDWKKTSSGAPTCTTANRWRSIPNCSAKKSAFSSVSAKHQIRQPHRQPIDQPNEPAGNARGTKASAILNKGIRQRDQRVKDHLPAHQSGERPKHQHVKLADIADHQDITAQQPQRDIRDQPTDRQALIA